MSAVLKPKSLMEHTATPKYIYKRRASPAARELLRESNLANITKRFSIDGAQWHADRARELAGSIIGATCEGPLVRLFRAALAKVQS